jgi:hypothetical protein
MDRHSDGAAQRGALVDLLSRAEAEGRTLPFWWRDDDAVDATPALDRLLALAQRHRLHLALAVIPRDATAALAARLSGEERVTVLQHGWSHANYAGPGEKKIELDSHRPTAAILDELRRGRDRMAPLFGARFLPVLVPPWNRIAPAVEAALEDLGLVGLSMFGPEPSGCPGRVNVHLDIFAWQASRRPLSRTEAFAVLCRELERRLSGDPEPIGIMTHHLVHEPESWNFLDELFDLTADHPAVSWPQAEGLFGLDHSTDSKISLPGAARRSRITTSGRA